mmetsp:Transcript_7021/g.26278  ORF Transcript_7021/g.26278 Transcript_7021/m.26278 type:complete len:223 (+) Transcript_7021:920-1588(+)
MEALEAVVVQEAMVGLVGMEEEEEMPFLNKFQTQIAKSLDIQDVVVMGVVEEVQATEVAVEAVAEEVSLILLREILHISCLLLPMFLVEKQAQVAPQVLLVEEVSAVRTGTHSLRMSNVYQHPTRQASSLHHNLHCMDAMGCKEEQELMEMQVAPAVSTLLCCHQRTTPPELQALLESSRVHAACTLRESHTFVSLLSRMMASLSLVTGSKFPTFALVTRGT